MFKKFSLIISISLGLIISGCASSDVRSFFTSKIDCGNGWRAVIGFIYSFKSRVTDAAKVKSITESSNELPVNNSTISPVKSVNLTRENGGAVREAQAARGAPTFSNTERQVLDMPKLFKNWSYVGISDDELKFLPTGMCAVSSAKFVKCKFSSNLSFKHYFSNISCTPIDCFSFLKRIQPVDNFRNSPHEPMPMPSLPFSESIKTASNEQ